MRITDEDSFIEAMARVLGAGMPPMAGRMWAYLAICDPPERTAAEIADRLQASRGSVSTMARILEHIGLVRRRTKPGDRREHFYVPPDAARQLIERSTQQMRASREVLDAGLALVADRPAESQARLRDLREAFAFFEREWPALLERFHQTDADDAPSVNQKGQTS
ncbi:MAG TPA: MarR family transcriptional regulator [Candidatus Angelobacter sp.]|nr:MarR family transcriptional regulator [Candidatus Angelobacter sp.]